MLEFHNPFIEGSRGSRNSPQEYMHHKRSQVEGSSQGCSYPMHEELDGVHTAEEYNAQPNKREDSGLGLTL